MSRPTFLMCSPGREWNVVYDINPWMTGNEYKVDSALALEQWTTYRDELSKYANIIEANLAVKMEDVPDMVFTANAGYVLPSSRTVLLSHFNTHQRSIEEDIWERYFLRNGYVTIRQTNFAFEGAGDFLAGKNGSYFGYGFRSGLAADVYLPLVRGNIPWYTMKLIDPRFYHLDTCFCPLNYNLIMCYPPAIDPEHLKKATSQKMVIAVSEEEAKQFCCNAVVIDKHVFMPKCYSVADTLSKLGYEPHLFDMSEFIKAGGACKCLTLEV